MATYYVRADGTSGKAEAVGPATDASACMSMAGLVSSGGSFEPDDIIVLSGRGGDFTDALTLYSNGSIGHEIILRGEDGNEPTITVAGTAIDLFTKHVKIENIHCYNTNSNSSDRAIYLRYGINVTITGGTASSYYYGILCSYGTADGITIDGVNIIRAKTNAVYISGATSQNVTIKNLSGLTATVRVKNCTNLNISNVSLADIEGHGIDILDSAGYINISDVDITTATGCGVLLTGISGTHTLQNISADGIGDGLVLSRTSGTTVISNCAMSNGSGSGYRILGDSHNIILNDCVASNMLGDGFANGDGVTPSHDITYNRCNAYGCGDKASTAAGDGFTSHGGDYNIELNYCMAIDNICSGFAMTGNSEGKIVNCTAVGNAGDYTSEGGVDQNRGGAYFNIDGVNPTTSGSWIVRNTIFANNYPFEIMMSASAASIVDSDYNCIYERTEGVVASLDYGETALNWAAYAENEANSIHCDPSFVDSAARDYSLLGSSPCIGAGAIITGIHDQGTPATDINGDPVLFAPNIGAYDGRSTKVITENYAPTGYEVRTGAKLHVAVNDITIDLTGLTNNEAVEIQARSKTFTPLLQSNNIVRAMGGGGRGMGLGL